MSCTCRPVHPQSKATARRRPHSLRGRGEPLLLSTISFLFAHPSLSLFLSFSLPLSSPFRLNLCLHSIPIASPRIAQLLSPSLCPCFPEFLTPIPGSQLLPLLPLFYSYHFLDRSCYYPSCFRSWFCGAMHRFFFLSFFFSLSFFSLSF